MTTRRILPPVNHSVQLIDAEWCLCAPVKHTNIGSDNGLSYGRRQAFIWTIARILLIGPLGINFREILIEMYTFSFSKMHSKMSSGKWQPFYLGRNVLICTIVDDIIPTKCKVQWTYLIHADCHVYNRGYSYLSIFICYCLNHLH